MKTLNNYISETILDIEDNIKKGIKLSKELVKDSYVLFNIYITNGNGSQVELNKYLKINDITKYYDKLYKQYRGNKIDFITNKTVCKLAYILMHTPLLGFDQNMLVLLRSFLKKYYLIQMETDHRRDKFDFIYTIYPEHDNNPADEVDIHFILKKNF